MSSIGTGVSLSYVHIVQIFGVELLRPPMIQLYDELLLFYCKLVVSPAVSKLACEPAESHGPFSQI